MEYPQSLFQLITDRVMDGHTKRRPDAGTDDGTAGEVISCPVLIAKDDETDDGLTFRHC